METKEVCCHPGDGIWFVAIFFGAFGALGMASSFWGTGPAYPALGAIGSSLVLGGPLVLISLATVLYWARTQIIADESGLRWRSTWGGWHIAAWAEVTDYFMEEWIPSSGRGTRIGWVQTQTGAPPLAVTGSGLTNGELLCLMISRHAPAVAAPGWRTVIRYYRNLPLTGHYDTALNRNTLFWLDRLHGIGFGAVAVYFGWSWLTKHTLPGWGWLLTPTGLFFLGKQTVPFLLRPTYRATERRMRWQVTATREGLGFANPSGETFVFWDDITDFYAEGMSSVIVTPTGEYDFLSTLTNHEQFRELIPKLALRAGQTAWRTGTVRRRQVRLASGEEAVQHCYHYRTQDNCGRMWGMTLALTFAGLVTAGPALLAWGNGRVPNPRELALTGLCVLFAAALAWIWGQYWTASIRVDADGLTQYGGPKVKRLLWSEVQGYVERGHADLRWHCVQGRYGRLCFWSGLGDGESLSEELAAHLPVVNGVM